MNRLAGKPVLGVEAQAATEGYRLSTQGHLRTCDIRGKTHLIAQLYGAGQLDGVLKISV